MDGKMFISSLTFLLLIVISTQADEYISNPNQYTAIYYGDSNVNVGDSFTITCIIHVSDPIFWLKDGTQIARHNLRHGKDDHAFIESESSISDKFEIDNNFKLQTTSTYYETPRTEDNMEILPLTTEFIIVTTQKVFKKDDILVPNYDNVEQQLKVFDIKASLVLSCNITKETDDVLVWEKNGTDVSKVAQLKGRYRIIKQEKKFIIDKTLATDDGLYSCSLKNEKKNITVIANVAVRVPSNTGVVEGEKLTIQCTVVGTDPKIAWEVIGNRTIENSTDRFILQEDDNRVQNALFIIENASLADRGEYKCIARNLGTEYAGVNPASDVSFVRVKGKMAALWPFLGICAEVFVLCAIILIYERRRNKTELEESDTDQNNEQKKKRRNYD